MSKRPKPEQYDMDVLDLSSSELSPEEVDRKIAELQLKRIRCTKYWKVLVRKMFLYHYLTEEISWNHDATKVWRGMARLRAEKREESPPGLPMSMTMIQQAALDRKKETVKKLEEQTKQLKAEIKEETAELNTLKVENTISDLEETGEVKRKKNGEIAFYLYSRPRLEQVLKKYGLDTSGKNRGVLEKRLSDHLKVKEERSDGKMHPCQKCGKLMFVNHGMMCVVCRLEEPVGSSSSSSR